MASKKERGIEPEKDETVIVQLKIGGPRMFVEKGQFKGIERVSDTVACVWFNADLKIERGSFLPNWLRRVEEE